MKAMLKIVKIILKLMKPLIKLGIFDGFFKDLASQLCEDFSLDFDLF